MIHTWSLAKGDRVDPQERILSKVVKTENGCWIWQGYKGKYGHAKIKFVDSPQGIVNASLYSWYAFKDRKVDLVYSKITLSCNDKACVNPEHLIKEDLPKTDFLRFMKFVKINKENKCWEWIGSKRAYGYGGFMYNGKYWSAHRWIFQHKNGDIQNGLNVCHKCDNTKCVNPSHLFLGTTRENMRDMFDKNRNSRVCHIKESRRSDFTKDEIKEIITSINNKTKTRQELADKFLVSRQCIGDIYNRLYYKDVEIT